MATATKAAGTATNASKDDKDAAPFVMPAVALVSDYEPVKKVGGPGRQAQPNPFTETVAALVTSWDDELKRTKAGAKLTFSKLDRTRIKAKFSKAANAAGFTPQYDDKAEEKGKSVMVAYLVPKVTRNRKPAEATATEAK